MFKNLRDNPILIHQMRHARWPSLRTAVRIAAGLMVVELALIIAAFPLSPRVRLLFYNSVLIILIEILLLFFGPLLTAVVAAVMTVQAINSEAYQIVRLSQFIEHRIIRGYVVGTLFRLRAMWMVAGGLLLPLIMAVTHVIAADVPVFFCLMVGWSPASAHCTPPEPSEFAFLTAGIVLIYIVCIAALFIAWSRLAATLGVWMAFRLHRIGWALAGALLPLAVLIALQVYFSTGVPCVMLMFAGADISLVWVADREAARACEAHGRISKSKNLLLER